MIKPHILISTIVRNRADKLPRYFQQIEAFVSLLKDRYDFSIAIYENDSTDESKSIMQNYDYSSFIENFIKCEDIGTQYFSSIISDQRVINYAAARNRSLDGCDLTKYRWMLIIEPDIIYTNLMMEELITQQCLGYEPDIYSGVLMMNGIPYDLWGMRRTQDEEWGGCFSDYLENPIKEFWSTANGICIYNMKPFSHDGLQFSSFNKRLNKHDCDTAVLCEDFRQLGYNKIFINQLIQPIHEQ